MAIRFRDEIERLAADLSAGGFTVRSLEPVPHTHQRAYTLGLSNGATVCWDKESFALWAEGPHTAIAEVESYLRKIYEGPQMLRRPIIRHNRLRLRIKKAKETGALWLIRSEALPARVLRRMIASVPHVSLQRQPRARA